MATDHNFKVKKGLNILNGNLVIDSTTHNYIELDSNANNTKTIVKYKKKQTIARQRSTNQGNVNGAGASILFSKPAAKVTIPTKMDFNQKNVLNTLNNNIETSQIDTEDKNIDVVRIAERELNKAPYYGLYDPKNRGLAVTRDKGFLSKKLKNKK